MLKIILSSVISLSLCALLLQILIAKAQELQLLDTPGGRKHHKAATPLVGGLAIGISASSLMLWPSVLASNLLWFWPPLFALLIIGLYDDRHEISPRLRFATQVAASLMMIYGAGVSITNLGDLLGFGAITLGMMSVPITIFAVASAINAFNMIDGLDGLAGGLAFIPLVVLTILAAQAGLTPQAMLGGVFTAGCFTFLLINYRFPWATQAKAFLGDTGSTILGFVIAWLLIDLSEAGVISPVTALYLIAVPLIDTAAVLIRRKLNGRPLTAPGRDHIHHILRNSGLSVTATVVTIHALALLIAAIGLSLAALGIPEPVAFAVFCGMLVVFTASTAVREQVADAPAPADGGAAEKS